MDDKNDILIETEPEFTAMFTQFAFQETAPASGLDDETQMTAILASLLGCAGTDEFHNAAQSALARGLKPVQIREIVYEAVPYLGFGRIAPFFEVMNQIFRANNLTLPLENENNLGSETALAAGISIQEKLIGPHMKDKIERVSGDSRNFNMWLAQDLFGNYYTRGGLDLKHRALAAYCFLFSKGCCESELRTHVRINLNAGNTKETLIGALTVCLPYVGFPMIFNALNVTNSAVAEYRKYNE